MTTLKLYGRLSYIDKQVHFVFDNDIDPDRRSHAKLVRACDDGARPYTRDEFTVSKPPADISEFVGRDCIVHVTVVAYSFKSSYDRNRGDLVTGHRLQLRDIRLYGV